jgi:peptidoglycan-associated lipoprotein
LTPLLFVATILAAGGNLSIPSWAQWKYDITLTGYPHARWKCLTSYIDKPTIADIRGDGKPEIVAVSVFGDVYCVDGVTGRIIWAYEDERSFELALYICPVIVDTNCDNVLDVISVTPKGAVICLDGRSGRKIWSYQAEGPILFSPSAFDFRRKGTPYIAVTDTFGNIYLLDHHGALLWKSHGERPFTGSPSMGVIEGQALIILGDREGSVRAFDGTTGKELWKLATGSKPISTSPLVFRDSRDPTATWKVLVGTEGGELSLANALTGGLIWRRVIHPTQVIGDFALGDVAGDGNLEFVFSTSGSRIVAAHCSDGKEIWNRKLKLPVKEYLSIRTRKKIGREVLTGQPILADVDGDGHLDVVVDIRGLNNYIYGLHGRDGRPLWAYGNRNLLRHPALRESTTLGPLMDAATSGTFARSVPAYGQPTPVIADFDGDGTADLIINDRDEIGLINIPIPSTIAPGTWPKYAANPCNNNVYFSLPCLAAPDAPALALSIEPREIYGGESARLCWNGSEEASVDVDGGIGRVRPSGCIDVHPVSTTMWHAKARHCGVEVNQEITLQVRARPTVPPPLPVADTEDWSLEDVFFEYDWYRLTPEAQKILDQNSELLSAHPGARVALEASCDERGSRIYNKYLAIARAESVREYLVGRGIDGARLEPRPEGETMKWDSRHTDEGWAKNRRVHFVRFK